MKRLLTLPLLLLCACDTFSDPEATDPLSVDSMLTHLNALADDSMYGRGSGTAYELEAAEYIRSRFEDYGLVPAVAGWMQPFTFQSRLTGAQATSQNVLGVLPGHGDLSEQWVILGAHYDHVGYSQVSPDSVVIFNGADDNASGTAMLLELARYLSHYYNVGGGQSLDRRSLMFQAFGAEESGLCGSRYFVANPTVPIESITAMVNLDMIGRLRQNELNVLGGLTSPLWEPLLSDLNDEDLQLIIPPNSPGRSDHASYHEALIPAIFFYTGTHDEYHQPEDDVWLLNLDGMRRIGDLALDVLMDLSSRSAPPEFTWN